MLGAPIAGAVMVRSALLASAALALSAGCSSASSPAVASAPPRRASAVACRPDSFRPALLEGITTAVPLDALELRRFRGPGDAGELLESRGDLCGALAPAECEEARRKAAPDEGFLPQCEPGQCTHYLLLRRGDRLAAASTVEQLVRVLGPIDTEHEALLLAWASAVHVGCKDGALDGEIVPTAHGYRYTFEAYTGSCPPVVSRLVVDIDRDGAVKEIDRTKLREEKGCILVDGRSPGDPQGTGAGKQTWAVAPQASHFFP